MNEPADEQDVDGQDHDQAMTLDPPGSIAVVGAGAVGVEAALYGRFLGYDVTLIEAVAVGQSLVDLADEPLPMLPDRCLSPLAASALESQLGDDQRLVLPTTCREWIEGVLIPLTESDLLHGRLRMPARVSSIRLISAPADDEGEDTAAIPPDFRLTLVDGDGGKQQVDVEAVVLAVGPTSDINIRFDVPAPYYFQIAAQSTSDDERDLREGLREIVALFAELSGRPNLDLYRPLRG